MVLLEGAVSTTTKKTNAVAEALRETLISPNVADANLEPANLVDVINRLASAIFYLANAIREAGP